MNGWMDGRTDRQTELHINIARQHCYADACYADAQQNSFDTIRYVCAQVHELHVRDDLYIRQPA